MSEGESQSLTILVSCAVSEENILRLESQLVSMRQEVKSENEKYDRMRGQLEHVSMEKRDTEERSVMRALHL